MENGNRKNTGAYAELTEADRAKEPGPGFRLPDPELLERFEFREIRPEEAGQAARIFLPMRRVPAG